MNSLGLIWLQFAFCSALIGTAGYQLSSYGDAIARRTGTFARESLTIVGWVAMWRPMQLFLYEWWPLARRIATYKALARAHVKLIQSGG